MGDPTREAGNELSFWDTRMTLPSDVHALLPEAHKVYYESTNQMHCGPGEGGSKFTDPRVKNIFDVVALKAELASMVEGRTDDRDALRAAGAPESAFLPAVKGPEAPPGLPEALYFKVEGVEGRLGIIQLKDLPPGTRVIVRREKGHGKKAENGYTPVSFTAIHGTIEDMPKTDFATVIVGRAPGEKDEVWTVHPGAPVRPAMGEFGDWTQKLVGPGEVAAGEKQPARVMTVEELMKATDLKEEDYIKIVPGNLDEVAAKYNLAG
jgi:hypothetical protein